jgi:hypothetical protein
MARLGTRRPVRGDRRLIAIGLALEPLFGRLPAAAK